MPLTQLYKKVQDSVVRVLAVQDSSVVSSGSGSIIDQGRIVLTCEHCVLDGTQAAIQDPKVVGKAIYGNVIFSDKQKDIALIEFSQVIGTPLNLVNSRTCEIGNGAFVVGYPMGVIERTIFSAHISAISDKWIRIDASVNHGNSGGPLFNLNGDQIGVVNVKYGSLSQFPTQVKDAKASAIIDIYGIDPIKTIQKLIEEMKKNLNLGIGYAIPTNEMKTLHSILDTCIR